MQTEESRQLVLDYYAAVASGDGAAMDGILCEDVVWAPQRSAPLDGPFKGRDVVLQAMQTSGAKFFDMNSLQMNTRKIVADGDTVVVLQELTGRTIGGHDYSNEYVWVYTCADGRIVRMDEHTDSLRLRRILDQPPVAKRT